MSDINVTPLVDVVLVLLIIFMVTAPMMQRGVDIRLPRVESAADAEEQRLVVTLGRDQRIYLNDQVVGQSLLGEKVRDLSRRTGVDFVFLRADREVPYGRVMLVMDAIKKAGIEKVGLVTEPGPPPRSAR
ncbi:MAG TPA: biopolymer transporter ExbD [Candidatus Polarisedimenticolia bacterium]|jgi:biopolymer transport protein TolR|nr:biopolymer transporter ExbD [Candidatus Polarisedimenticolia bacterium]